MAAKPLFVVALLILSLSHLSSSNAILDESSVPSPSTAHAELNNYGFPTGLLPADVLGYSLNTTSGEFAIRLGDDCKLTLPPDNYKATYSRRITGKIVAGRIADLDGIRVRAFFKWWSITGIRSSGDDLVFEVGMVTAKYPSKNFVESPACEGKRSDS
ncbi:uncharacterized protein LOC127806044 [Diospyros lotus]|uniref:uncharacterized protein LOC127806044 n=1 Tax=Diospyros lotus TaxID=55363 RepID=UPI0022584BAE|nr:uncharacterized protein LOC127806044 [Diospyros lotus]XP_052198976.1 uncharacterized protein LOC127806044 [Diospyros lotus]XP_052198977.1 uncharacterized protein LOC127806044 [Diospyros lotus]